MIFFVGCSFTWGAGLQYEYLHKEEGWDAKKINNHIPPDFKLENLNYNCDMYRRKNRFPNLVAKKINKSYAVANLTNGGSNCNSANLIQSAPRDDFINTYIIQFTQWHRDVDDWKSLDYSDGNINNAIEEIISHQVIEVIKNVLGSQKEKINGRWFPKSNTRNVKWYGISWNKDIGDFLYKHYSENHIPIIHNKKEYTSFDQITKCDYHNTKIVDDGGFRICDVIPNVNDAHLSSNGHRLMADSISKRIMNE